VTVGQYYFAVWACTLVLTGAMAATSGAVPWVASLFQVFLCLWILYTHFRWQTELPRLPKLVGWVSFIGYCIIGAWIYSVSRDLAHVVCWGLLGALAPGVQSGIVEKGFWKVFAILGILNLVCLIASEDFSSFGLFFLFAPTFLCLLNAASLRFHLSKEAAADEVLPRSYFISLLSSMGAGLTIGAAVFVLFPRSLQWQNPLALRSKDSQSGYSGSIELGANNINISSKLALTVDSSDKKWLAINGPGLYFRANALDRFDGKTWSRSNPNVFGYISSRSLMRTRAYDPEARVQLNIFREPHTTRAVIFPGVLRELKMPRSLQFQMRVDAYQNLERSTDYSLRYAYELSISPERLPSGALAVPVSGLRYRASKLFQGEEAKVPQAIESAPWFNAFLQESVGALSGANLDTVLQNVERYFQKNFRAGYQGETQQTTGLESFLSTTRYGHCEYFATAAVLALRASGVPARVVLGYRGGTFNPVSQVLEVRESEAHAWVEYLHPDLGWLPFDPTPIVPRMLPSNLFNRALLVYSAVKFWFERYVMDYNADTQTSLLTHLNLSSSTGTRRQFPWKAVMALAGVVIAVGIGFQGMRRYAAKQRGLPRFWIYFESRSRRRGVMPRAPGESLKRFSERAASVWPGPLAGQVYRAVEQQLYASAAEPSVASKTLIRRMKAAPRNR
jgi:hypothetical protein